MRVLTQHGQPVTIFGLVDLAAREPGGEHLFRRGCRSCVRSDLAISGDVSEEANDAGDKPMLWSYQNIIVFASNRPARKRFTRI